MVPGDSMSHFRLQVLLYHGIYTLGALFLLVFDGFSSLFDINLVVRTSVIRLWYPLLTVNENCLSEEPGLPEYSLNRLGFVHKPGLRATGSGFTFRIIRVMYSFLGREYPFVTGTRRVTPPAHTAQRWTPAEVRGACRAKSGK